MVFSIKTFSIMIVSIKYLFGTLSINDSVSSLIMLSVAFHLAFGLIFLLTRKRESENELEKSKSCSSIDKTSCDRLANLFSYSERKLFVNLLRLIFCICILGPNCLCFIPSMPWMAVVTL